VQLRELRLFQFRNVDQLQVSFSASANLFVGRNGQGKTNILEAIYLLAYGKSFRTAVVRDCIQRGRDECVVAGIIGNGALERELQVAVAKDEKKLMVHGKPVALAQFVGNLHMLAFASEHLGVVRGAPGERRAFLDRAMIALFPGHLHHLAAYARALRQRNRLLAEVRDGTAPRDGELLETWDEALIRNGLQILRNRTRYVQQLKEFLPAGVFGTERLTLHYLATVVAHGEDVPDDEAQFRERLARVRRVDERNGYTSVGPHRDDLKLFVNGMSLPDFGSAGQQRSCLLSLLFAQMEVHRKAHGVYPVFLVDDIEGELDDDRLRSFLDYLVDRTQTFMTTAKGRLVPAMPLGVRRFEVSAGRIVSVSS